MNLLRLIGGGRTASAPVARERLQILLAHERGLRGQPDLLGLLRTEILAAVARHIVLDPDKVIVRMERGKHVSTLEVDIEVPHGIETCLNPLLIILVWDGKTGAPARREFYGPSFGALPPRYPYGPATLLVRKCFVSSQMITIAGQILRDASAQAIPENETAASPGRVAAAFQNQDQNSIPGGHSPEGKRERRNAQALSSRGPGPSTSPRRKTNGRRHPDTPDPGHVSAEGAD